MSYGIEIILWWFLCCFKMVVKLNLWNILCLFVVFIVVIIVVNVVRLSYLKILFFYYSFVIINFILNINLL